MSDKNYSYYKYLRNYSPHFINKYENWSHFSWGRKTNFTQLQLFRSYILLTNKMTIIPGYRTKSKFYYAGAILCVADLWGIWFYQEIYNKYTFHKWTHYQPWMHKDTAVSKDDLDKPMDSTEEKRPQTRVKYSDKIKIVYDGEEQEDVLGRRRFRYR